MTYTSYGPRSIKCRVRHFLTIVSHGGALYRSVGSVAHLHITGSATFRDGSAQPMAQPELCHRAPAAIASADIMAAASSEVNRLSVASRPGFAPTVRLHVAVVAGHLSGTLGTNRHTFIKVRPTNRNVAPFTGWPTASTSHYPHVARTTISNPHPHLNPIAHILTSTSSSPQPPSSPHTTPILAYSCTLVVFAVC